MKYQVQIKFTNPSHEHVSLRRRVDTITRVVEAANEAEALNRAANQQRSLGFLIKEAAVMNSPKEENLHADEKEKKKKKVVGDDNEQTDIAASGGVKEAAGTASYPLLKKGEKLKPMKLKEGFDPDPSDIAAHLVKKHGKGNVTKDHVDAYERDRDSNKSIDKEAVMKHIQKMSEEVEQIDEAFDKSSPAHAKAQELVSNYGNRSAARAVYHGDGSATIHTTGDKKVSSATRVDHIHDQAGLGYNRSAEAYKNSSKSKGGLKFKTKETEGKSIYGSHEIHISHNGMKEEVELDEAQKKLKPSYWKAEWRLGTQSEVDKNNKKIFDKLAKTDPVKAAAFHDNLMRMRKKDMKEEVESIDEGVATAQKVMDRANVVAKTNPDPKKRFAAGGLANKAMMRTINPTGVNTGIVRGGGNKAYRKITGKAPPHQLTKKTGVSEEVVTEASKEGKDVMRGMRASLKSMDLRHGVDSDKREAGYKMSPAVKAAQAKSDALSKVVKRPQAGTLAAAKMKKEAVENNGKQKARKAAEKMVNKAKGKANKINLTPELEPGKPND